MVAAISMPLRAASNRSADWAAAALVPVAYIWPISKISMAHILLDKVGARGYGSRDGAVARFARRPKYQRKPGLHCMSMSPEELLRAMFAAAIAAAQPEVCLPPFLPEPHAGRLIVIGAGKASAAMAEVVENHWPGPLEGLVVTRDGDTAYCRRVEIIEAGHPVPDARSVAAARRVLSHVQGLTGDDFVLCLISGGGSSLLSLPAPGLSLADKQALTRQLLTCGASIREVNCVRRHLSAIKGGRLAAACHPARLLTLMISDVPGDRAIDIASGPTVADPTTCADALDIVARYAIALAPAARDLLESGRGESIKPGDPRLVSSEVRIVVTPRQALHAAAAVARRAGVEPILLGDAIEGEAREVGKVMAGIALSAARHGEPARAPCVLISGGETTVTVEGNGRGRTQCRISAVARHRARRRARYSCPCRRHRRRRWPGRGRRRLCRARHVGARLSARDERAGFSCTQRRAQLFRSARKPGRDRADTHQCQRFSCDSDRLMSGHGAIRKPNT